MCGSSHACNPGALRRLKQLPQARGQPVPHNEFRSVEASEQHPIVRTIKPAASAVVDRKSLETPSLLLMAQILRITKCPLWIVV